MANFLSSSHLWGFDPMLGSKPRKGLAPCGCCKGKPMARRGQARRAQWEAAAACHARALCIKAQGFATLALVQETKALKAPIA